ncbi:transposase [Streptococcus pneumoniae]|nr:transposase [Streptococcus pneumoniae]
MEELVTLDCLFIDGTKIEANANKYSFVWKKTTEKFSAKLQEQIQVYFQEEITPLLIKYAMFDKKQKRGYKQSAKNLANWHYNDKEDKNVRRFYLPKIDRFSLNARLMWNLSLGR